MTDEIARKLQYDYKSNSNLVLPVDQSMVDRRGRNEATGEALSSTGHLQGTQMDGDAQRTGPSCAAPEPNRSVDPSSK